jgi:hypothetical protein
MIVMMGMMSIGIFCAGVVVVSVRMKMRVNIFVGMITLFAMVMIGFRLLCVNKHINPGSRDAVTFFPGNPYGIAINRYFRKLRSKVLFRHPKIDHCPKVHIAADSGKTIIV